MNDINHILQTLYYVTGILTGLIISIALIIKSFPIRLKRFRERNEALENENYDLKVHIWSICICSVGHESMIPNDLLKRINEAYKFAYPNDEIPKSETD